MGYCPWVHKESDTTERLSTHIEEGKGFGHCISSTFSVVGITQIANKLFFVCAKFDLITIYFLCVRMFKVKGEKSRK